MTHSFRIAFLSEHASPVALLGSEDAGGQNVYVDEVTRTLGRFGYAVDIFTRRDSLDAPEIIDWAPGVRVVNLSAGPPRFLLKDQLWPLMPTFRTAFLRFMMRDGARYDLIHGNFWMSGWVAVELQRRLRIPAVQIFHAMGLTKRRHQGEADTSPEVRIEIEMGIVRAVTRLIAQCPSERAELIEDYGADPEEVEVIPSGVNIERFRPVPRDEARRRVGLDLDEPVIVYVGRMLPRKDVRNVVRALAILTRRYDEGQALPRLLLVGGETAEPDPVATPEIGELQRLAVELGVADRVCFAGKRLPLVLRDFYSAGDSNWRQAGSASMTPLVLRDFYSAGDVAVTTPWYEPFGLTPLEAMACGRPVIGSAVGGITFTVEDGVTGFHVPPRTPEVLADRLHELLTQPELRAEMGRAARARVERKFTWPMVAQHTAMLYEALLASNGPSATATAGRVRRLPVVPRKRVSIVRPRTADS